LKKEWYYYQKKGGKKAYCFNLSLFFVVRDKKKNQEIGYLKGDK